VAPAASGGCSPTLICPEQPRVGLELVEARLVLEPRRGSRRGAGRAPDAVGRLEAAAVNALLPPEDSPLRPVHFHVALAAASGNALLREAVEALLQVRAREQVEIRHRYNDRERDHAEHVEIFEAYGTGTPGRPSG